uniref:Uncharacterized protein n=1 Tax=Vitis vinifera TaxID=29760 RepID=F6GXX1_VITVI
MAKDEGCSFELQTYSNVVEIPTRKGHRKSIFFVSRIREKEMVICYPNKGPFAARFQLLNQRWSSLASLVSPWNQNPTTRRQKGKRKPTKRIEIGTRNNFSQPYLSFIIPSCRLIWLHLIRVIHSPLLFVISLSYKLTTSFAP